MCNLKGHTLQYFYTYVMCASQLRRFILAKKGAQLNQCLRYLSSCTLCKKNCWYWPTGA